ncbi:MAG: CPBP family intramembrane metalloprotease [Pedosphaera sp.]|nr:CPBP family intramembrane metalloprotease [Pedosphaera sp.]
MAVFSDTPVLSFLNFLESHDDFHRYFNRCLMLLALVGLSLLWRVTKIKSWAELGWTDFPKAKNHISIGLLIGLASLMAIAALGLIFEAREFRPAHPLGEWGKHWLNTLGAAIAVGVLEETLFRGMLFGLLRRDMNWRWAAVASALLFASVHFIDQRPNISEITWSTGFTAFPQFIHDFAHDPHWPAYAVNLFLAGLILAGAFQRTGNLFIAIGIHAGWIIALKTNSFISSPVNTHVFWGDNKTSDGWAATPLLAVMAWYILRHDPKPAEPVD